MAVSNKTVNVALTKEEIFRLAEQLQREWEYLEEMQEPSEEAAYLKTRSRELYAIGERAR